MLATRSLRKLFLTSFSPHLCMACRPMVFDRDSDRPIFGQKWVRRDQLFLFLSLTDPYSRPEYNADELSSLPKVHCIALSFCVGQTDFHHFTSDLVHMRPDFLYEFLCHDLPKTSRTCATHASNFDLASSMEFAVTTSFDSPHYST